MKENRKKEIRVLRRFALRLNIERRSFAWLSEWLKLLRLNRTSLFRSLIFWRVRMAVNYTSFDRVDSFERARKEQASFLPRLNFCLFGKSWSNRKLQVSSSIDRKSTAEGRRISLKRTGRFSLHLCFILFPDGEQRNWPSRAKPTNHIFGQQEIKLTRDSRCSVSTLHATYITIYKMDGIGYSNILQQLLRSTFWLFMGINNAFVSASSCASRYRYKYHHQRRYKFHESIYTDSFLPI